MCAAQILKPCVHDSNGWSNAVQVAISAQWLATGKAEVAIGSFYVTLTSRNTVVARSRFPALNTSPISRAIIVDGNAYGKDKAAKRIRAAMMMMMCTGTAQPCQNRRRRLRLTITPSFAHLEDSLLRCVRGFCLQTESFGKNGESRFIGDAGRREHCCWARDPVQHLFCQTLPCSYATDRASTERSGEILQSPSKPRGKLSNASQPVAPGHNFLFGHLIYLKGYLDRIPKDAHFQYAFGMIATEHFPETGAYYIDLWPMTGITLVIISPKIGTQLTQTNAQLNCNRPKLLQRFLGPITDGPTMFDVNEAAWKPWRTLFNKGFHSDHINSLVPGIIEDVSVYTEILRTAAKKGEMIFLEPITLRFMIDVIGKTIL